MHRLFINKTFELNKEYTITDPSILKLSRVIRLQKREKINVFDDKNEKYLAKILDVKKKEIRIQILEKIAKKILMPEIILIQGIPKSPKFETIIQKAVELGVSEVYPFISSRTIPKITDKNKKLSRWEKIIIEAIRQSGGDVIPKIYPALNFVSALELFKKHEKDSLKIIFYENEQKNTLKKLLQEKKYKKIYLAIGPEGGFSQEEILLAKENGFHVASLGENILRVETASIAAIAIVKYEIE